MQTFLDIHNPSRTPAPPPHAAAGFEERHMSTVALLHFAPAAMERGTAAAPTAMAITAPSLRPQPRPGSTRWRTSVHLPAKQRRTYASN